MSKHTEPISVVIPNWNGKELLAANLPILSQALELELTTFEILVVDDASTDGSAALVAKDFPQVALIQRDTQGGFSAAVNTGIHQCRYSKLLLLNSDICVIPGFIGPLLPFFSREDTFAVANVALKKNGESLTIPHTWVFKFGTFREEWFPNASGASYSFGASGGHALFDRHKLVELGGFDEELFSPFYYEDADLSYRAWKRGYRIYYEPDSRVYHDHKGTVSKINARYVALVRHRNRYLFIWKNIRDWPYLLQHLFFLPFELAKSTLREGAVLPAFLWAVARLPIVLRKRREEKRYIGIADSVCLDMIRKGIRDGIERMPCDKK